MLNTKRVQEPPDYSNQTVIEQARVDPGVTILNEPKKAFNFTTWKVLKDQIVSQTPSLYKAPPKD